MVTLAVVLNPFHPPHQNGFGVFLHILYPCTSILLLVLSVRTNFVLPIWKVLAILLSGRYHLIKSVWFVFWLSIQTLSILRSIVVGYIASYYPVHSLGTGQKWPFSSKPVTSTKLLQKQGWYMALWKNSGGKHERPFNSYFAALKGPHPIKI